jgi:3-dehydroquinate synthase
LNDLDFVDLLPARDKIAGMAEAVKVALIRDRDFFRWLERHALALAAFDRPAMAYMIRRCAELHMRQIATGGDPFETGSARPLDFGHWAAHKLESLTRHHLRHGEAVAIGIALDTRYSVLAGLLEPGAEERVCALLELLGFRLWSPALEARTAEGGLAVLQGLQEFREHLGGELTVTLLQEIGRGVEVHAIDEALVVEAIRWLAERARP